MEVPQAENIDIRKLLVDRIDKNSEGWEAVIDYRDQLYRNFFAAGTTDLGGYNIDIVALEAFIDKAVEMIAGRFEQEDNVSYQDIRELLAMGTVNELEKRTHVVEENTALATHAITQVFQDCDLSELTSTPQRPESSL